MKKYLNYSLYFAIYGLCCGVFFREFTKFNGYTERTMLGMAHPHVLMLGFFGFIILAIFVKLLNIEESKKLKIGVTIYNIGIIVASVMMLVRGVCEVLNIALSSGADAAISGIAGLGHIATAAGIIRLINIIRKAA